MCSSSPDTASLSPSIPPSLHLFFFLFLLPPTSPLPIFCLLVFWQLIINLTPNLGVLYKPFIFSRNSLKVGLRQASLSLLDNKTRQGAVEVTVGDGPGSGCGLSSRPRCTGPMPGVSFVFTLAHCSVLFLSFHLNLCPKYLAIRHTVNAGPDWLSPHLLWMADDTHTDPDTFSVFRDVSRHCSAFKGKNGERNPDCIFLVHL